jgi:hypothetical protein
VIRVISLNVKMKKCEECDKKECACGEDEEDKD